MVLQTLLSESQEMTQLDHYENVGLLDIHMRLLLNLEDWIILNRLSPKIINKAASYIVEFAITTFSILLALLVMITTLTMTNVKFDALSSEPLVLWSVAGLLSISVFLAKTSRADSVISCFIPIIIFATHIKMNFDFKMGHLLFRLIGSTLSMALAISLIVACTSSTYFETHSGNIIYQLILTISFAFAMKLYIEFHENPFTKTVLTIILNFIHLIIFVLVSLIEFQSKTDIYTSNLKTILIVVASLFIIDKLIKNFKDLYELMCEDIKLATEFYLHRRDELDPVELDNFREELRSYYFLNAYKRPSLISDEMNKIIIMYKSKGKNEKWAILIFTVIYALAGINLMLKMSKSNDFIDLDSLLAIGTIIGTVSLFFLWRYIFVDNIPIKDALKMLIKNNGDNQEKDSAKADYIILNIATKIKKNAIKSIVFYTTTSTIGLIIYQIVKNQYVITSLNALTMLMILAEYIIVNKNQMLLIRTLNSIERKRQFKTSLSVFYTRMIACFAVLWPMLLMLIVMKITS